MAFDIDRLREGAGNDSALDEGLRSFLLRVYLKVAGGLAMSAAIAWAVASTPAIAALFFTQERGEVVGFSGWGLALVFAPVLLVFVAALLHRRPSARESGLLYWTVAALVGGSLSVLAFAYTGAMLVTAFLVTACAFVALSLWGYVTRRNLAGLGNFLAVGLFGLIVAFAANLLLRSSLFEFALDIIGVMIFAGLIAADTQRLKLIYYQLDDPGRLGAASNYGALSLYLNFINLFELLLSLMSARSRR